MRPFSFKKVHTETHDNAMSQEKNRKAFGYNPV